MEKSYCLHEEKVQTDDGEGLWEDYRYQIIQCQGCETVSFRILYNNAQYQSWADEEEPWTQEVYPKRDLDSLPIKPLLNTPQKIKNIYKETIDAYNYGQTILCTAGLRAIIEGICLDKGVGSEEAGPEKKGKLFLSLERKIQMLASKGFLTEVHAGTLHELRFLGNEALHKLSAPSEEELRLAIEIIEHSIENIYELHHIATKLKKEKAKRKDS